MMHGTREIEKKFVVKNCADLEAAFYKAHDSLKQFKGEVFIGRDFDRYWEHPRQLNSTVRLRSAGTCKHELTVKTIDRGSNEDREELNVSIDNLSAAIGICSSLCSGDPVGTVEKKFFKYTTSFSETAVYQVEGSPRIFLEVESTTMALVDAVIQILTDSGMELEREPRSVYEMFIREVPK